MAQPTYKLRVPDEVTESLRSMHPHLKKKIRAGLKSLLSNPASGKALKEELSGLRSLRVSRFRIIYRVSDGNVFEIAAIGPRERIYEETLRLLKKKLPVQ